MGNPRTRRESNVISRARRVTCFIRIRKRRRKSSFGTVVEIEIISNRFFSTIGGQYRVFRSDVRLWFVRDLLPEGEKK